MTDPVERARELLAAFNRLTLLDQPTSLEYDMTSALTDLADRCEAQEREIERLRGERDHWKHNHDHQVRIKQALHERLTAALTGEEEG